jgi:hypothetical protein
MTSMERLTAALFDAATPRVVTRRQKRAAKQARKGRRAAGTPATLLKYPRGNSNAKVKHD